MEEPNGSHLVIHRPTSRKRFLSTIHHIRKGCVGFPPLSLLLGLVLAACAGVVSHPHPAPSQTPLTRLDTPSLAPTKTPSPHPPTATVAITAPTITSAAGTSSPSPTSNATPYVYAYGPDNFPPDINPLTGLPAADPTLLERRPMVIKVTHFPRSVRPQWGLALADHVFEYYIGDNMSRFIAVFYGSDASRVGPIRSARLFDEHIMRMYRAIFAFGYADDLVLEPFLEPDLRRFLVIERPDNCPPLCRIGPKYAYNNLYTDTRELSQYITARGTNNERQNLNGLRFELAVPESGNVGEKLSLQYSTLSYNRWEYDEDTGRYLRFQETADDSLEGAAYAPLTDSLTGGQISANNVLILYITHEYILKSSSTEVIDMPIDGQGTGYAFRDGQIYPITWIRNSEKEMLTLLLPNELPYPLKPGNIWFEIIGESSPFELQTDGSWNFEFGIP